MPRQSRRDRLLRLLPAGGRALEAAVALLAARLLVRYALGPVVRRALQPAPFRLPPPRHVQIAVARALARGRRLLPGTSLCLPEALAGKWMLRRRGFGSALHLGVARTGAAAHAGTGHLQAHAWLEAGGHLLCGAAAAAHMKRLEP